MDLGGLSLYIKPSSIERQINIAFRKAVNYKAWRQFLMNLQSNQELVLIMEKCHDFGVKILRPYLANSLTPEQRLKMITDNYTFWTKKGLFDFIFKSIDCYHTISTFEGKNRTSYAIKLKTDVDYWREGEHILTLFQDNHPCYSISFLISYFDGFPCIYIGAIQGEKDGTDHQTMKVLTKDFHGLRPKDFMILVMLELGKILNCFKIFFVNNSNRICTLKQSKAKHVYSDYDQTWIEFGANPHDLSFFELSPFFKKIDIQRSLSKRRTDKRKRLALIQEISNTMEYGFLRNSTQEYATSFQAKDMVILGLRS